MKSGIFLTKLTMPSNRSHEISEDIKLLVSPSTDFKLCTIADITGS